MCSFLPMRVGFRGAGLSMVFASAAFFAMASNSQAALIGSPTGLGASVFLTGLAAPPTSTYQTSLVIPYSFTTTAGLTTGTLYAAVFKETTGGTLDFYYQLVNSGPTSIARETDTNFLAGLGLIAPGVSGLGLGFLTNGSALGSTFVFSNGYTFQNGTVAPQTGDLNAAGTVVGFSFGPQENQKIPTGATSTVFFVSTNATTYTAGNASVIDGGTDTRPAFQPASGVPEPGTMLLMGLGMVGLAGLRRVRS